jgi:hypothetical protein
METWVGLVGALDSSEIQSNLKLLRASEVVGTPGGGTQSESHRGVPWKLNGISQLWESEELVTAREAPLARSLPPAMVGNAVNRGLTAGSTDVLHPL